MAKLQNLTLVPEQQSVVDSGIRFNQWAVGRAQSQQLFNELKKWLISSISSSRQQSTVLMVNGDLVAAHHHQID